MATTSITKRAGRIRRHSRIRARVIGTEARPRLAVYKSNRYLHVQLIDDAAGKTLVAGSTKTFAGKAKKTDAAQLLGADIAKRAKSAGITKAVFDRGGSRYTGRIATLAEAVRKAGLEL